MAGLVALALAYMLSQFYRSFMAVLTPALTAELGATKADLSLASGMFFIAFALAQFPVGVWLDRHGPRITAASILALCGGGGALLFAVAREPWMITLAMTLLGLGCAPVLMASLFIFARIYSPARFAVLTSWLVAFGTAGNVIGASPLAQAADAFGWRTVMTGLAAASVLVAIAAFLLVRDPKAPEDARPGNSGMGGYMELLRIRALWPIIPLTAVNYAPAVGIRGLWAGPYLTDIYAANTLMIGSVTLFMAIAMVVGAFVYGPLDTLFGTRKWVAVVGNSIAVAAFAFLALSVGGSIDADTAAFVVIGITGCGYGLLMAHARAFFPPHLVGRGVTLMNFFAIGGIGVMQFATGWLVSTAQAGGLPSAYAALFWFYAICLALAIILYLWAQDAPPERAT